ncbi:hypothetical protein KOW79_021185 [Hemibagrus wyckioides]|uniref:Uncharacterized protein n=1 Tax=Hemibagrus wyckioides TaxID=337641 RepID=A0A9D3S8Z5_9TELE|nr:hypothetical protein KOW79_021185 [Hemibagrus wyckioides]
MKPSLSHLINSKWTKLAARDRFAKHQRRNATCSAALPFVFQECVFSSEDSRRARTRRWSSRAARRQGASLGFIVICSDFRDKTDASRVF